VRESAEVEPPQEEAGRQTIAELGQDTEEYEGRSLWAEAKVENIRRWAERQAEDRVKAELQRLLRRLAMRGGSWRRLERGTSSAGDPPGRPV